MPSMSPNFVRHPSDPLAVLDPSIEGLDRQRDTYAFLFGLKRDANIALRMEAEPVARMVLGDQFVDNPTGWLGWDVAPVYDGDDLVALNFTSIVHDDCGPDQRKTVRVAF